MAKAKYSKVKAIPEHGRVILHERDAEHENGEAFIYADGGAKTHNVGLTAAIEEAIARKQVRLVGGRARKEEDPPKDDN